jgi:hypothetical protein
LKLRGNPVNLKFIFSQVSLLHIEVVGCQFLEVSLNLVGEAFEIFGGVAYALDFVSKVDFNLVSFV